MRCDLIIDVVHVLLLLLLWRCGGADIYGQEGAVTCHLFGLNIVGSRLTSSKSRTTPSQFRFRRHVSQSSIETCYSPISKRNGSTWCCWSIQDIYGPRICILDTAANHTSPISNETTSNDSFDFGWCIVGRGICARFSSGEGGA